MERLRALFVEMGFAGVETFIASGNVLFDSSARTHEAEERRIERGLRDALGYDVPAFIRSAGEVAAIAAFEPFTGPGMAGAVALNIAFLAQPPDATSRTRVLAMATDIDTFRVHGREVYWMCRKKQSESLVSGKSIEKAIGGPCTVRGVKTVRRLAETMSRGQRTP